MSYSPSYHKIIDFKVTTIAQFGGTCYAREGMPCVGTFLMCAWSVVSRAQGFQLELGMEPKECCIAITLYLLLKF